MAKKEFTVQQQQFIAWLSTPKRKRTPKTQVAFAQDIGVDPATLSRWAKDDDLKIEVVRQSLRWIWKGVPEFFDACLEFAMAGKSEYAKIVDGMIRDGIAHGIFTPETVDINVNVNDTRVMTDEEMAGEIYDLMVKANKGKAKVPRDVFVQTTGKNRPMA